MRFTLLIVCLLILPSFVLADPPASQPSQTSDVAQLQEEIGRLKSEVLYLTTENKSLRQKLAASATKPSGANSDIAGTLTKLQVIAERKKEGDNRPWGLMEDVVAKYLKTHDRPRDIQLSLYNFVPKLAMSEPDVDTIFDARTALAATVPSSEPFPGVMTGGPKPYKKLLAESLDERTVFYFFPNSQLDFTITFSNNVATKIDFPKPDIAHPNKTVVVTHGLDGLDTQQ